MASSQISSPLESIQREKKAVALNSVIASVGMTGLKLFVGFATGSLGLISEAAHSGLDLVAAIVTLLSVQVSDRPADADHQYGHGKVENFSAFIETGLLLLTCIWIVYEAIRRLFYHHAEIEPSIIAFVVLIGSMFVDFWRSKALARIADKYDSQALQADALHFRTDIWSSGVVAIGLILVWLGRKFGISQLAEADPIAALLVAGVIVYVSSRLARQTVDALLDAAPPGGRAQITEAIKRVPDILEVDRVRIRRAGNRYFADLTVGLARSLTFQRSEQLVESITGAVHRVLPEADVIVRSIPRATQTENIFDRIRAVAARNNFGVHDISVQDFAGRLHVEQHLELDEHLTLKNAHDIVTRIEAEMREEIPEISSILTHIESEPATIESGEGTFLEPKLETKLRNTIKEFSEILDMHDLLLKKVRGHIYLSCHCTMPDSLSLSRVHEVSTGLEIRFKQVAPELFKVLIHTEPQTDNRR